MTYHRKDNTYTLSSGRRFYANCGYIGLGPDGAGDSLPEGHDGAIELRRDWDPEFEPWTAAERAELADAMIERWQAFKGQPVVHAHDDDQPAGLEDRN